MDINNNPKKQIKINCANRSGFASLGPIVKEVKKEKNTKEATLVSALPVKEVKKEVIKEVKEEVREVVAEIDMPQNDAPQEIISNESADPIERAFEQFEKLYPQTGYLRAQAFTARRSIPVEGAHVVISKSFPEGEYIIAEFDTDESGMTYTVAVPADKKELSQQPGVRIPYTSYNIRVEHPDYVTEFYKDIPVFQDIVSLQVADLLPKSLEYKSDEVLEVDETDKTKVE